MNVSLTPELEKFVEKQVATGLYGSASEVIREALRLLTEREMMKESRLRQLREELARGMTSAEAGRLRDGEVVLREVGRRIRRARKKRA